MKFGSVFSGIGGFEIGLERAGWECAFQIENDKFCNKVLARRWPNVPRYGDVKAVKGSDLGSVDLLVGGFPCQDLSIAGKRAGITADRSGLFFEFARLARDLQPKWVLVENVHGLLSSHEGEDFRVLLSTLADLGHGLAWRTLDSRYFGVPQRRRRVFIVGCLGGPVPYEVLFESEGGGGHPPASGKARSELAGTLGGGAPGARGRRDDLDTSGAYVVRTRNSQRTSWGQRGTDDPDRVDFVVHSPDVAHPVTRTMFKHHDEDTDTLVAVTGKSYTHALKGGHGKDGGFDASEDGTGRGTPIVVRTAQHGANGIGVQEDEAYTLDGVQGQAIAFNWQSGGDVRINPTEGRTDALHSSQVPAVLRMRAGKEGGGKGPLVRNDESLTLATNNDQAVMTFRKVHRPQSENDHETWEPTVRRLTPTECERLQGFPDGWTHLCDQEPYSTMTCKCPDGPRYAALGNAVTTNVVEWIGLRLARQYHKWCCRMFTDDDLAA